MATTRTLLTCVAFLILAACRSGAEGVEHEDPEYYCAEWAGAWCLAYAECDTANFPRSFQSIAECIEASERSCLEPLGGGTTCPFATQDETDLCVDYIVSNHPDGCHNLFGPSADWSPCEDICERGD